MNQQGTEHAKQEYIRNVFYHNAKLDEGFTIPEM